MCGVVAVRRLRAGDPPIRGAELDAAGAAIAHRGPDGDGLWCDAGGDAAIAHRRLALVDLEHGAQPIHSEDGAVVVAVTGELYGAAGLRRRLERRGHHFRSRSDSEVAVHLYEESGIGFLDELRGEFALVLWDARTRTLLAARDRFGIKPLVWARTRDRLIVASEAKGLFAAGVTARWDASAVRQHLLACGLDGALFAGVSQVPPGHVLRVSDAELEMLRWWDPPPPAPDASIDEAEAVIAVRNLVAESVRSRLEADVPVGCLVSGGLDSSAVLAAAARASSRPIDAFTAGFDHISYDETERARAIAAHTGARLHVTRVDEAALAAHFDDTVTSGETLCLNGHAVARWLLARDIRAAGIKAVLGGDGADELFAGYLFFHADGATDRTASPHLAAVAGALGAVPPLIAGLAAARGDLHAFLTPEAGDCDPYRALLCGRAEPERLRPLSALARSQAIWNQSFLPGYVLAAERLDMAWAVEVRQPLLDHHLFHLTSRLPPSLLVRDGEEKRVLRQAAAPWLPPSVTSVRKQPFTAPPATLTAGPLLAHYQEILRDHALDDLGFIDLAAVRATLDELPSMPTSRRVELDPALSMLASLGVLHHRYVRGGGR